MPRQFLLKLDCETTADDTDNEGAFETATWVSPDGSPVVDPNTGNLALTVGDQVAFAIGINQGANPTWLTWLVVIIGATTQTSNRAGRLAGNNSPFRMPGTVTPLTLLVTGNAGNACGFSVFQGYNADGSPNAAGPYIGTGYNTIVGDTLPDHPTPIFPTSKYEATVVAHVIADTGLAWQFSYDPEMDVDNGSGG